MLFKNRTGLSVNISSRFFLLLLCAFAFLIFPHSAFAKSNPKYASFVMDADTGAVLHQRYANKKLHPASLTKVMTLLLVFDALDNGRLKLNDRVRISRHAASMVPSKLNLPMGSSIKVEDAIYALVTKSANDVAAALAEHLGGSEHHFAKLMTIKARRLGMHSTNFRNASGLHDPKQVTTARDMAKMARYLIKNHPGYYKYFSTQYFTYQGKTYRNHNRLMESYAGMDGLKTGYISASGFNLIASAIRSDRRLIGVVFGGRSGRTRNAHMKDLLDRSFAKLDKKMLVARADVPQPKRKPDNNAVFAQLDNISPASGAEMRTAAAHTIKRIEVSSLAGDLFQNFLGQGDFDPDASNRIETGLMAISAHRHPHSNAMIRTKAPSLKQEPKATSMRPSSLYKLQKPATLQMASLSDYKKQITERHWAIQIGAFANRARTDQAINMALDKLPKHLRTVSRIIMPLKNGNSWIFRGRLQGYSRSDALSACKHLQDCLPIKQ